MTRIIECADPGGALSLDAFVEALREARIDPEDEESFAAAGPLLARLGRDRRFLGDIAIAELKARCGGEAIANQYSPQTIMLHRAGERWFLRANLWPAANDAIVRDSGTGAFFYGLPHDHNFSFLTVGYFGPGYWSDYYEYDHGAVSGLVGEAVDLRFLRRSRLEQGQVLLYRAHRDVHDQAPPDSLSVSINIMEAGGRAPWFDQYRFDLGRGTIAGLLNATGFEAVLALAAHLGGDDGRDLLDEVAVGHPTDRIRFGAIRARASAARNEAERVAVIERGAARGGAGVAARCAGHLRALDSARRWAAG